MLRLILPCEADLPHAKSLGIPTTRTPPRVMEKNGFVLGDKVENLIDGQPVLTRRTWRTL